MSNERRAAVALIQHGSETLLIKRKNFPGDPWSGHIAFPGGHVHDEETIEQGLLREIREEVGLNLSESQITGRMDVFHPVRAPYMSVYPIILDSSDIGNAGKGPEVDDLKVVNLKNYVETTNPENGFPALEYAGWLVWGLTYRIIRKYLEGV